ncbi:ATP-dependent RNA helicase, partial [Vibrio alfacsensis]
DEFHERRWDTDLLVSMLKRNQTHKTVITSATIEGQKLADYFDAKRLVAQGRVFDVAVQHHRNDSRQLPDARHLETRVKSAIEPLLDELAADILVFVPG